jgi:hypothetical protein
VEKTKNFQLLLSSSVEQQIMVDLTEHFRTANKESNEDLVSHLDYAKQPFLLFPTQQFLLSFFLVTGK